MTILTEQIDWQDPATPPDEELTVLLATTDEDEPIVAGSRNEGRWWGHFSHCPDILHDHHVRGWAHLPKGPPAKSTESTSSTEPTH